jgi:hypothetical protein
VNTAIADLLQRKSAIEQRPKNDSKKAPEQPDQQPHNHTTEIANLHQLATEQQEVAEVGRRTGDLDQLSDIIRTGTIYSNRRGS